RKECSVATCPTKGGQNLEGIKMFNRNVFIMKILHLGDVEYGQMIACDGDNCPVEWFHVDCLGLNEVPDVSLIDYSK
uniref:Zinc finger PHD-type domain-containing protein n=1 Tax=Amphimedon queenslandica TaxID=400682 RepID=A0A1X7SSF5_AMPQE